MNRDKILIINDNNYVNERSISFALDGLRAVRPEIAYHPQRFWSMTKKVLNAPLEQVVRNNDRVVAEHLIALLENECEQPRWADLQGSIFADYGIRLVLLSERLCGRDGASIMGASARCGNNEYALISAVTLRSDLQDMHVIAHELGHAFGAPSDGRRNTEDVAGLHCTSDLCVMRNQLTAEESNAYAKARYLRTLSQGRISQLYCGDCAADISENVGSE